MTKPSQPCFSARHGIENLLRYLVLKKPVSRFLATIVETVRAKTDSFEEPNPNDERVFDQRSVVYEKKWKDRQFRAYMNRGQFYQSLADFSEAIVHNPGLVDAHVNRAVCYLSLGDYRSALAEYNLAIAAQPTNARWIRERAAVHAKLNDGVSSRKDMELAARLSGKDALPAVTLPTPLPAIKRDPD